MERIHPAVLDLCSKPLEADQPETVTRLLQIFEMSYSLTGFYKFGSSLLRTPPPSRSCQSSRDQIV